MRAVSASGITNKLAYKKMMKHINHTVFSLITATVSLLLFQSCLKDDLSDCPSDIRIYFDYVPTTYASAKEGISPENVARMDLYVFDADGYFVRQYTDANPQFGPNYYMTLSGLNSGNYRFIAWSGLVDHYSLSNPLTPGESSYKDLQVYLNCIENNQVSTNINYLFYASKGDALTTVVNYQDIQDTLSFVQNTYKINVTVNGITDTNSNYNLSIEDDNGILNFDNSIASSQKFQYITTCIKNNNSINGSINVLRLTEERTPTLRVKSNAVQEPLFERDLIELILMIRTLGGTIDFSYMHEFDIELTADPELGFTITINGWPVVESENNELDK